MATWKDRYGESRTSFCPSILSFPRLRHPTRDLDRPYILLPSGWKDRNKIYRSEEHTSELQSRENLVCRLLLEKKNRNGETTSATSSSLIHTTSSRSSSPSHPSKSGLPPYTRRRPINNTSMRYDISSTAWSSAL